MFNLSYALSDALLIALLMKFICETYSSKLVPWPLLAIPIVVLPFLLGLGGRPGNKALRLGVSIAGIIIYVKILTYTTHGTYGPYLLMVGAGLLLYMMGRIAQRTFVSLVIAIILISAIVTYLLAGS